MRAVVISDTHTLHNYVKLPEGEVLIHCGDLCNRGTLEELEDVTFWLNEQKFKHIVAVGGNHDDVLQHFMTEKAEPMLRKNFFKRVSYLRDSGVWIDGRYFHGSPWTPDFGGGAFMRNRGPWMAKVWENIPERPDVLITHGPPIGYLDRVGDDSVGCGDLRNALRRIKPKTHLFGHVHCAYGKLETPETNFYNAALANTAWMTQKRMDGSICLDPNGQRIYKPVLKIMQEPWVIEI